MDATQPPVTDFDTRVRARFTKQAVMSTIGASLSRIAAGEVDIELPFRSDLTQQQGFFHAGIVATIVDSACGYAASTLMPPDAAVPSTEAAMITRVLSRAARMSHIRPGKTLFQRGWKRRVDAHAEALPTSSRDL